MMRKIIILILSVFAVFQFALAHENKSGVNEWDFGKVKQGEVLKHNFVFRNMTAKALNITNIHTSCGCAASQSEKKILKPGESTLINVSFNSKGYLGQVTQFVYVNTDSAEFEIVKFTIKAEVIKEG